MSIPLPPDPRDVSEQALSQIDQVAHAASQAIGVGDQALIVAAIAVGTLAGGKFVHTKATNYVKNQQFKNECYAISRALNSVRLQDEPGLLRFLTGSMRMLPSTSDSVECKGRTIYVPSKGDQLWNQYEGLNSYIFDNAVPTLKSCLPLQSEAIVDSFGLDYIVQNCLTQFAPLAHRGASKRSQSGELLTARHLQTVYAQHLERCVLLELSDLDVLLENAAIGSDKSTLSQTVKTIIGVASSASIRPEHVELGGIRLVKVEPTQPSSVRRAVRLVEKHLTDGEKPYVTYVTRDSGDPIASEFHQFSKNLRDLWIDRFENSSRYIRSYVTNRRKLLRSA